MNAKPEYSIILFDGVCNLCNGVVQFILRHDKAGRFKFAALQSDTGQRILRQHGLPPEGVNSFLLLENGRLFSRSTAALRLARRLGGFYSLAYLLMLVPQPLRDFVYKMVATNRYRFFGQRESCAIPTPDRKERFLDNSDTAA